MKSSASGINLRAAPSRTAAASPGQLEPGEPGTPGSSNFTRHSIAAHVSSSLDFLRRGPLVLTIDAVTSPDLPRYPHACMLRDRTP